MTRCNESLISRVRFSSPSRHCDGSARHVRSLGIHHPWMGRIDRGGGTVSSARRFTGIGATIAALAIILSGCLPPKPPPPPPPKFRLAAGLWHTFGTAPGATECHFARLGADGRTITDVHSTAGSRYVETADTDSEFVTSGCQTW